ncbi:MAG: gluconate 2-dehydrogenase subunit 3 family protein [Pseudomonadota bacterium]
MTVRKTNDEHRVNSFIDAWRQETLSRRRFLLGLAGGSLAALMPLSIRADGETASPQRHWQILEAVQDQLFPSEPDAPGARELNALNYLKWVVGDAGVDAEERRFILRGVDWLEDMSRQAHDSGFLKLSTEQQAAMLKKIAQSDAGENWLSTLLLYIFEALLTDPVYGGNPDAVGWRWLGHRPGFPRPTEKNRYRAV